jgi:NDP-sugar pyrophosphorylase family protein
MALIPNPRPDLYGGVLVEDGYVAGFARRGSAAETFHFIGVQIAEAAVFAPLPDGVPAETVMQLYPQLIRENPRAIAAHIAEAMFDDVGSPADYLNTSLRLAASEGDRLVSGTNVSIDATASVRGTAVWDDVRIGANARLDECIVCDRVAVPDDATFTRCAIVRYDGHTIREGDRIEGQLLTRAF